MTGAELYTQTTAILDGLEIESVYFYQLLNIAKTKLEEQRLWQYLKKVNSATTASSAAVDIGAYTDFAEEYKVMVGQDTEYTPVPFEEQQNFRNSSGHYYIDWANMNLYLLGATIPSKTLYIFYKRFTPDIASGTSPVFPTRFHPILAYYVAAIYQTGTDSDDIFARMGPVNKQAAMELERAMKQWDSNIALRAQDNRIGVANSNNGIPLELM